MKVQEINPIYICQSVEMIKVDDALPPLFVEVLVFGMIKPEKRWDKLYFSCPGFFIARRWSGWSCGWDEKLNKPMSEVDWHWCTHDDYPLFNVTHWMPIPVKPQ